MNDILSSQEDKVCVADLRAEIHLSHIFNPPFPKGICYYLGIHHTSDTEGSTQRAARGPRSSTHPSPALPRKPQGDVSPTGHVHSPLQLGINV